VKEAVVRGWADEDWATAVWSESGRAMRAAARMRRRMGFLVGATVWRRFRLRRRISDWGLGVRGPGMCGFVRAWGMSMQVRLAAGLNLLAACAGVVFFALTAYRLAMGRVHGAMWIVWLVVYAGAAWFFWGQYRHYSGMGRG
jgi:hypothetical protein